MKPLLRYTFFFLLIFTSGLNLAAQDTIDSLTKVLGKATHDTIRVRLFIALSDLCEYGDIEKYSEPCIRICEKSIATSEGALKNFYLDNLGKAYNLMGLAAWVRTDNSIALSWYRKGLAACEQTNNKMEVAGSLGSIGRIYHDMGDIPKAFEYMNKSVKIFEEINAQKELANVLSDIGLVYNDQGNVEMTLNYYFRSLKLREAIKDKEGISSALNNIAGVYNNQGEMRKALDLHFKSLKIREEMQDKLKIGSSLNNIGTTYDRMGEYDKAFDFFTRAFKMMEAVNDKYGKGNALSNIGRAYYKKGDFAKSLDCHKKALEIGKETKVKSLIIISLQSIAEIMYKQNRVNEALPFALEGLSMANEQGFPGNIKFSAIVLRNIYKKQNRYKEAYEMRKLEARMQDSMLNAATSKNSLKKQFQYEYEKKAEADSIKNAKEFSVKTALLNAQQAQLNQEKTQRFVLYGGIAIVIIFLGFIFNRFRLIQKQRLIIEKQKEEVDSAYDKLYEKNKETMDSIRYANRIQRSLLTTEVYIEKELKRLLR